MPEMQATTASTKPYKAYHLANFHQLTQLERLPGELKHDIEVVGHVLPFKVNNFVVEHLIEWEQVPNDPMFTLTFPQRELLLPEQYEEMAKLLAQGAAPAELRATANRIRMQLNPHPGGQLANNVPRHDGETLHGMQHKYRQTVLFFPTQGQTCHAYCSFCFRWPQFVGISDLKFATREVELLVAYLREHEEVTDVLFTGGDPLIMSAKNLGSYVDPLLDAHLPNLRRIRIGTKALTYWPYKFLNEPDSEALLALFRRVVDSGKHLALMAHFNHWCELQPSVVQVAISRIRQTGAEIRTQSPLLRHINDQPETWIRLWNEQVDLGCIPYYMFIARDTGAQHYFAVPLVRAWEIFRNAYKNVSGLCRTVRGPSMSANPGKIQLLGVGEVLGHKVMELRMLQGRNPDWVHRPFFAEHDETATWINQLKPAFGEDKFFFEEELESFYRENLNITIAHNFE
jgi:KamA family protein